jgi:hypothetical protein
MKNQVIKFDDELEAKINNWRGSQNPIPPFNRAVVLLLNERLR